MGLVDVQRRGIRGGGGDAVMYKDWDARGAGWGRDKGGGVRDEATARRRDTSPDESKESRRWTACEGKKRNVKGEQNARAGR